MTRYLIRTIVAVAVLLGAASALSDSDGLSDIALAVDGCVDVDGDGTVHLLDSVMISAHNGVPSPPSPPQVDINKDGAVVASDIGAPFAFYETSTDCQTNPLAKTTLTGGALAVDAFGWNTSAVDPVQSAVTVLVGDIFRITIHVTSNPEMIGFQVRLHWDEALLELDARTSTENDLLSDLTSPSGTEVTSGIQALGPTDDGISNEAYIELMSTDLVGINEPPVILTTYEGPVAQFEFTCEATGIADLTMSDAGNHTVMGAFPATEFTPALANAVVLCFSSEDGDGDGLPDSFEGDNLCLNPLVSDAGADPDGDGLDNLTEFGVVTNPCAADTDGDGLTDDLEVQLHGTNPNSPDTDGDGLPDDYEVGNSCLDPLTADGEANPDGDNLDNLTEFAVGTDPCATTVGGIAELPEVARTARVEEGSSGPSAGVLAGVAAAITTGAIALRSAAWYARRRG